MPDITPADGGCDLYDGCRCEAPAAASPAAGVIADRLRDAGASRYSEQLRRLWQETTGQGPWDD